MSEPWHLPFNIGSMVERYEKDDEENNFTGIILYFEEETQLIHVQRDDDSKGGSGIEYEKNGLWFKSWRCSIEEIEIVTDNEKPREIAKIHVMGLSPETIDPDAYASFMGDL